MSIKVRAKAHPFKDSYDDFYCEAAPLSRLFEKLNSPLDITHARFLIDDEMVTDLGRTPPDGSTVYINMVPMGTGNATQDAGKGSLWAGIGLMAVGIIITVVSGGTLAPLGVALIGSGVGLVAGGAVLLNTEIPTPSTPSVRETGNQLESIRGSKNKTRKSGYIPVLFGRHLVTPDAAALPYTEIDTNGQQWLTQLFCAGYNSMTVELESLKVGDTVLTELSQSKNINAILAGTDTRVKLEIIQNGAASTLYPRICVEQQFNAILKNKDDDGVAAPVIHTTADKTTGINVDILFPMGLIAYNDKGDKISASVTVRVQYKPAAAPDSAYVNFPGWSQAFSAQTADMFRCQATVSGLSPGEYTVKITRVTADSTDNKTIDTIFTGSIRAFANDRPVREEAAQSLTVIALKIRASALANGVIDNFNFVAQSNIPDYNPSTNTWAQRLTKNPASMLLYALRGKINPAPVADNDIDWDSLKEFWTFCNGKGYTCNAVQGDRELFSVLCAKIAKTGRASILRMNGKFSVVIDKERPAPVQLFSPRNTTGYHQTIVKADVPDEIAAEFIDETKGWASNERSVYNTPSGLPSGTEKTKQTSSIWGITDPDIVFKFARYQYACVKNRAIIHTLECDIEYLLCKKGDLIEYAGDTALTGIAHGKVTGVILYESAAIGITADTVFPQEPGKTYGIRCRKSNGLLITLNVINRETSGKDLRFETPQSPDILEEGDLIIFGLTGKITRQLVITGIAPADNFRATLTCADYSPEIFGVDDPAYAVPPFDNKITTSGAITDSGLVNTEEWQTWFTYHDSVMMPAKPTGGGATGGWHRYQTPESRWVSLKTARSITGGDWSIPAQTSFMVDEALRNLIAGTSDVGRPDNITGLRAAAGKDTIHITWNPLGNGLRNDIKHVRVEIKTTTAGDWQTFEVRGGDFVYEFNRSTDGYPEKSDLAAWRIRAKAENIYGQESVEYAPDAGGLSMDTSDYGTWKPSVPALSIAASGRTVSASAPVQTWYGAAGCEYQISKPAAGTPWYAPAMADTQTVYQNAGSWRGAEDGVYASATQLTQQLPLEGQDISQPKDTAYKYRARSVTKAYDGSILYRSAWGDEAAAIAKGTGVRDVVEGAIGTAQLQDGAVTNSSIADETIDYGKFNPGAKPPRKATALPAYPYAGYVQGDTVILISGTTANDEKLYRLVNPAAAGTAGWSNKVDGADLVDETIAITKMASGTRPTRTVSSLPALSDTNYQAGDTVVLLGDSKVYRRTDTGWTKTLDGVDILANTIRAGSLNVLAKNVINPFVDGLTDGWTLGPGCSLVDDAETGFKVLQMADASAGLIKISASSNSFNVFPDDIFVVKFGVECLTDGLSGNQAINVGIGPTGTSGGVNYKEWIFNPTIKKWQLYSDPSPISYFISVYTTVARNHYTSYILGKNVNIQDIPAPEGTDEHAIRCIQLVNSTVCFFRNGFNAPTGPRVFKIICPQIYRLGSGRIIAENILAHSITANEIAGKTLTADEIAARTLTGDEMAINTITTKNLAIGDFTNYATVNENIPASMLPAGFVFGQTLIDSGYIIKANAANQYLMLSDFPEGILQAGDEFYFEVSVKAAAAATGSMCAWGYSAINRVNGVVTGATSVIACQSATISLTVNEQRLTGTIKVLSTVASVRYVIFGFENTGTKVQVYVKNVIIRKKNAGAMIIDGAIKTSHMEAGSIHGNRIAAGTLTADEIAANTIKTDNLNVLAKNTVNPFVDGTGEGWTTGGTVVNVDGLGYVLKLSQARGKDFLSNIFTVLPDDVYTFKFGAESLTNLTTPYGLYVGLTRGQSFNRYQFINKKWVLHETNNTNAYFLIRYNVAARNYFTTYILGSRVDISKVPAPTYTDETYEIYCLQLTGMDTTCRIRSGYSGNQPSDAAWYFIQPQVYRIGGGKIIAENIITKNLSAISASLGRMTGSGSPDDDEYKIVLSDGFDTAPAGQADLNKKGTFLLGPANGESTIRRWWTGSVWKMVIRMSALILENLKSKVIGTLQVFGDWQNHDDSTVKPVFEVNPGSNPDGGSINARRAFRVHKSVTDEGVVLEALPNGNVNIPGGLSFGKRTYTYPMQTVSIPAQDASTAYYVKVITFDLDVGAKLVIREAGNSITGAFYVDLLNSRPSGRKIIVTYSKSYTASLGIIGFLINAPEGTDPVSPMELWLKVVANTGNNTIFYTYLSDLLSGTLTAAESNYQSDAPSNIIDGVDIAGTGGIATSGAISSTGFLKKFKTVDLSTLSQSLYYPVTTTIPPEKGFFEVIVDVTLDSGTTPSWSTHERGFSCFQHILVLAGGWGTTGASTVCLGREAQWATDVPVGWSQMLRSSTAILWLRGGGKYHLWDNASANWTIRTGAYTANGETIQPQTTQVFNFPHSTIFANLSAQSVLVQGNNVAIVNAATDPAARDLPVGSYVIATAPGWDYVPEKNSIGYVYPIVNKSYQVTVAAAGGDPLVGTWRSCGILEDTMTFTDGSMNHNYYVLMRRAL